MGIKPVIKEALFHLAQFRGAVAIPPKIGKQSQKMTMIFCC